MNCTSSGIGVSAACLLDETRRARACALDRACARTHTQRGCLTTTAGDYSSSRRNTSGSVRSRESRGPRTISRYTANGEK